MEDPDKVLQQIVGMEWKLFVIGNLSRIAGKDVPLFEGIELAVGRVFGLQIGIVHLLIPVVFNQPQVRMDGLVKYRLECQGCTAASW